MQAGEATPNLARTESHKRHCTKAHHFRQRQLIRVGLILFLHQFLITGDQLCFTSVVVCLLITSTNFTTVCF